MERVISVPLSAFILLLGLLLPLPELKPDAEEKETRKLTRRRAQFALLRIGSLGIGLGGLLLGLVTGPGSVENTSALLLLGGLYSLLILLVQRAERNRRVATLVFMAFCGLIVSRYAAFRDYESEEKWAVYGALVLNYGFWLVIGKKFPPADSSEIEVWGMEE